MCWFHILSTSIGSLLLYEEYRLIAKCVRKWNCWVLTLISLSAILPPKKMYVSSIFGDDLCSKTHGQMPWGKKKGYGVDNWRRWLGFRKYITDAFHCSSFYLLNNVQMHGRSLGMCKRCGDLRIVACSQCKGTGSARNGRILNLGMLDDLYESLGAEAKTDNLVPCTKCRSRGRLWCPECSKIAWPFSTIAVKGNIRLSVMLTTC